MLANVLIGGDAGHDHTGRGGDHQRRDLGHQAVTDGQQGIAFRRMAHAHPVLQNPDQQAAHHVDHHDQNTGDGIAANELTRTVHRAVEVGLLGHFCTAFFRFIFANQPGVEIGVNRHLFARHPVQYETRAHFRDTSRTFGDNHKVDDHEDDKHHNTDGEVAAHQEVAEGLNHLTCRRAAGMTIHQNDTGGGHVQRQT
ncbi:hypothetical protein D3C76_1139530 [compost metagenome]